MKQSSHEIKILFLVKLKMSMKNRCLCCSRGEATFQYVRFSSSEQDEYISVKFATRSFISAS